MVKFDEYHVLPVLGALSAADLQYARDLAPVFTSDNRWTVASLASLITPSTAQLPLISSRTGESTSVTFTQASSLYFSSNLTAVGPAASLWKAFQNQAGYGLNPEFSSQDANLGDLAQNSDLLMAARPVMVEFPLWGSRVACTTMRQGPEASTIRPLPSSVNSTRGVPDFFMAVTNETVRNLLARVDGDQDLASNPVLYNTTIDPNLLPTGQVISGTTPSISFFFFFFKALLSFTPWPNQSLSDWLPQCDGGALPLFFKCWWSDSIPLGREWLACGVLGPWTEWVKWWYTPHDLPHCEIQDSQKRWPENCSQFWVNDYKTPILTFSNGFIFV